MLLFTDDRPGTHTLGSIHSFIQQLCTAPTVCGHVEYDGEPQTPSLGGHSLTGETASHLQPVSGGYKASPSLARDLAGAWS